MASQIRICQNCKQQFTIEPEDFNFYKRIQVPPPTFCPECRQFRRYAWRNERTLYRRNCDLCGKSIVTIYSPNKPYKVYCVPCWWSDKWDASVYARDFDFTRPFFEQWQELHLVVPRIALLSKNSVNSEYTNHANNNKNCYLAFGTFDSENVLYSNRVLPGKDCCDCLSLVGDGLCEFCYECVNCERCYRCQFGYLLRNCQDCLFSIDLRNCSNCVLSWNLRNRQYCIENVQYSKDDYQKKLNELDLGNYRRREEVYKKFLSILQNKTLYKFAVFEQAINSSGNFISYSQNVKESFFIEHAKNAKYIINGSLGLSDAMDCYNFGVKTELTYECHAVVGGYGMFFSHLCYNNSFIYYCDSCHDGHDLFGCVGVKKGEYQILNKRYSKEEYEALKNKIIEHMKRNNEYGEFFPAALSPFGYNETQGAVHQPLTKEEALAKGLKWEDQTGGTYGKTTLPPERLPDSIDEVSYDITKEVLECIECKKNYNIISLEVDFYKKMNIPIPRRCPDCRYRRRILMRPPRKLWHRKCTCAGEQSSNGLYHNTVQHFHGQNPCPNEFETSYSPERTEIVYCEQCYNAEVV